MSKLSAIAETSAGLPLGSRGIPGLKSVRHLLQNPQGLAGVVIIGALVFLAVFAPVLSAHPPNQQYSGFRLVSPNSTFIFGTDELSRDIWSRVLYGLRETLVVSILSVLAGCIAGSLLGFVAGFTGGVVDVVLSRIADALLAFPAIVMAIAIAAALGPGPASVGAAIAIFNIPLFARLARASAIVERERDYVTSSRSVGASEGRLLFRHVVPNSLPPLLIQGAFSIAFGVLLEAGLSFLGLGTAPPNPSLGGMLNASRSYMNQDIWYPLLPGAALVLLLVGLNFLADAISELSDPRARR